MKILAGTTNQNRNPFIENTGDTMQISRLIIELIRNEALPINISIESKLDVRELYKKFKELYDE